MDIFNIDQKDLKKLMRFARKAPTHFRRASAGVLNDLAFSLMKINRDQITRSMIVRNQGFVKSSFRVVKAKTAGSISQQVAYTGSIRRDQFSGWKEQELGTKTERERIASLYARGGGKPGRISPPHRLKKGKTFVRPTDFKGKNYKAKYLNMVSYYRRRKKDLIFYMPKQYKRMRTGLYLSAENKITKLQDTDPRRAQPRRNRWMTRSIQILHRSFSVQASWKRQIMRNLPKRL